MTAERSNPIGDAPTPQGRGCRQARGHSCAAASSGRRALRGAQDVQAMLIDVARARAAAASTMFGKSSRGAQIGES
eukprot:1093426-Pyramimonas_sp.AAC.1